MHDCCTTVAISRLKVNLLYISTKLNKISNRSLFTPLNFIEFWQLSVTHLLYGMHRTHCKHWYSKFSKCSVVKSHKTEFAKFQLFVPKMIWVRFLTSVLVKIFSGAHTVEKNRKSLELFISYCLFSRNKVTRFQITWNYLPWIYYKGQDKNWTHE